MMNQRVVPILCVPRSGSSMVAGICHALEISMGKYLLPASQFCQRGHYEDLMFNGLHRVICFPHGDQRRIHLRLPAESPSTNPTLAARYRRAVACRMVTGKPWGVKDPRLTFAFDRFLSAVGAADVRIISTRRDHDESARSLMAMFNFSFTAADEVISTYRRRLDAELARWTGPQLEVDYAATLADPAGGVRRIAEFVGMPVNAKAISQVDPGLRRYGG